MIYAVKKQVNYIYWSNDQNNKVRMSKIKPFSVSRSSTKQELPTIAIRTPRSGPFHHSKSYLGQISKQFTGNAEYDQMDSSKLTKQQRKLKQILKKMNEDTVKIISDYTPKPKKLQHHRTATTILAVNEQQLANNQKIMLQCQIQIGKLQQRAQGLVVGGKQMYDEQINKFFNEVLAMQQETRNLRNQNDRRGKSILTENRIIEEGEIRKLQTDVYLAQHRASHLRADDFRVSQQIKQYEKKLKQILLKWNEADKFLKEQQKKQKQQTNLKNNEQQLMHRKAVLENTRKKNEFYNQNYQYKYLSLLRKLDSTTNTAKQLQTKIDKNFVSMQASKMIISKLENQLRMIKQRKKQKQQQINQFLSKTRNNQSRVTDMQKDMPSEIDMRVENNGDLSAIDLEQAIVGLAENIQQNGGEKKESRVKLNKYDQNGEIGEQRNDVLL